MGFSFVDRASFDVTSFDRTSAGCGDATILLSLPDAEERDRDPALFALKSEDAWLGCELGAGLMWFSGMLTGVGLLGALVCDWVGADAGGGAGVGAATGAGDGGLGGVGVVVECCANSEDTNNKLVATRLESRMTHLLPTASVSAKIATVCFDADVDTKDISELCQRG